MKLRTILGAVLLSGASFVAGHDYTYFSKINDNEKLIREYYQSLKNHGIILQTDNLNYPRDLNPEIRKLQEENIELMDKIWVYEII